LQHKKNQKELELKNEFEENPTKLLSHNFDLHKKNQKELELKNESEENPTKLLSHNFDLQKTRVLSKVYKEQSIDCLRKHVKLRFMNRLGESFCHHGKLGERRQLV